MHSDGEQLRDHKLVDLAEPMQPWLPPVYEAASGWMHLSPLRFTSPLTLDEQKATLGMGVPCPLRASPGPVPGRDPRCDDPSDGAALRYIEMWRSGRTIPLDAHDTLRNLPEAVRHDLLRVLASPSNVRANVIRQFNERGDEGMIEVLVELEADEVLRFQVITRLEESI
jgi:hypothetical protein